MQDGNDGEQHHIRSGSRKMIIDKRNTSPGSENVSGEELGYRKAHRKAVS